MAILNKYKDFIGEKWVDGNWQDDSHPIDDEDVKNIFIDYLDHFNLHEGFEVIKNFTGEHLNKYVFHSKKELAFDELLSRKHFLVKIKMVVGDNIPNNINASIYESNLELNKKYIYSKDASELILDISERMEDLGYYLRYPDIKIFYEHIGQFGRRKEIIFRFSKMAKIYKHRGELGEYEVTIKESNSNINKFKKEPKSPITIYKRTSIDTDEYVSEVIDRSELDLIKYQKMIYSLGKEYPEFTIHHRGNQYFDIIFKSTNLNTHRKELMIGCYDIVMKEFILFIADSIENYGMRKTTIERCLEGEEMDEGFERFVGLWYEIKDEII